MESLFWLTVVLAVITVLGHGMWVLIAMVCRAIRRMDRQPSLVKYCPACGRPQKVVHGKCTACGFVPTVNPERVKPSSSDIEVTLRTLQDLVYRGGIPPQMFNDLVQAIEGARRSLYDVATGKDADIEPKIAKRPAQLLEPLPATCDPVEVVEAELAQAPQIDESSFESLEAELIESSARVNELTENTDKVSEELPVVSGGVMHPLDRPDIPAKPRRSFGTLLQAFMEEKNIRWGEIISGLLIVVCAVGLVISLWATLNNAIPYLPALVFMLGTAALHWASHYTLRRWELRSICRAALITATLLIPLNVLAAITLTGNTGESESATDPAYLLAVAVGLTAYGTMALFACRTLLQNGWWYLFVAVMGTSVGQLINDRLNYLPGTTTGVLLVATLSITCFLVAAIGQLWQGKSWLRLSPRRAQPLFLVLGVATFSLGCALALIVLKADSTRVAFSQLSFAISLIGTTVLAHGLFVQFRTMSKKLSTLRMSGTALAIAGSIVLMAGVLLAWPNPLLLICFGAVNGVLLIALALVTRLSVLHVGGILGVAFAGIVVTHYGLGTYVEVPPGWELVKSFLTGETATMLMFWALVATLAGVTFQKANRQSDAFACYASSAGIALVSVFIACIVGFVPQPGNALAPPLILLYVVVLSIVGWRLKDRRFTWAASVLMLMALVQSFGFVVLSRDALEAVNLLPERPILVAFLMHSVMSVLVSVIVGRRDAWLSAQRLNQSRWTCIVIPWLTSGLVTAVAVTPASILVRDFQFTAHTTYLAIIAVIWLGAAWVRAWPLAWTISQVLIPVAIGLAIASLNQVMSWIEFTDPQHIATQILVLAVWCTVCSVVRRWAMASPFPQRFPDTTWPAVDQCLLGSLIIGLFCLVWWECRPSIFGELRLGDPVMDITWFENRYTYGGRVWLAWLAVCAGVLATLWERMTLLGLSGLIVTGTALPLLLSRPFESDVASDSAATWLFAVYGVLLATIFVTCSRLQGFMRRWSWPGLNELSDQNTFTLECLAVVVSCVPAFLFTTLTVTQVGDRAILGGPVLDAIFPRIDKTWSCVIPLVLVTSTLLAFATRGRRPGFALAGSFMFQYLVNIGCLLPVINRGESIDQATLAQLLQWNTAAFGAYALIWLTLARWIDPPQRSERHGDWVNLFNGVFFQQAIRVRFQIGMALVAVTVLALCAAVGVICWPSQISVFTQTLGRWQSYVALVLVTAALIWFSQRRLMAGLPDVINGGLVYLVALAAASAGRSNDWTSFHILMIGWTIVVATITSVTCFSSWLRTIQPDVTNAAIARRQIGWATGLSGLVLALALISAVWDPAGAWWSMNITLMISVVAGVVAFNLRRQKLASASVLLVGISVIYLWMGLVSSSTAGELLLLVDWVIAAMALTACIWLGVELDSQWRFQKSFQSDFEGSRVHCWVGLALLVVMTVVMFQGVVIRTLDHSIWGLASANTVSTYWGWLALFSVGLLLFGTLWDRKAQGTVAFLYIWGFSVLAITIDACNLTVKYTFFAVGLAVASYVVITGLMWWHRGHLVAFGRRLKMADLEVSLPNMSQWLPVLSALLCGLVAFIGLTVVMFYEQRGLRIVAGFFPAMLAIGIGGLSQCGRRATMQTMALLFITLSAVYLGWADIKPGFTSAVWLERVNRLLVVLGATAFGYSMLAARVLNQESDWYQACKRITVLIGSMALGVLVAIMLLEAGFYFEDPATGAPVRDLSLVVVSTVMIGLVAAFITMALLPGSDPWSLSKRGRMGYVYAAQAVAALLLAHLFLARPYWFDEELRTYWPYIIIGIAFAGAGTGELLRRAGLAVVGDPLQRSGAFLPLVPAIGMWIAASESEYSVLLFLVGIVYLLLSISRRSMISAIAAGIAGNGALWSILYDSGFKIWQQPQFWLLPPAISVLVAAEINRRQLPEKTLTAIRYASLLVIYVSSGSEMFIRGIGEQIWPPIVLLGFAVVGALTGALFRVQSFLYIGSTFVLLSLMAMVWHASVAIDQTWPWWVFGIGLGLAMLVFFGVFEKQREKITGVVEELQRWEQ